MFSSKLFFCRSGFTPRSRGIQSRRKAAPTFFSKLSIFLILLGFGFSPLQAGKDFLGANWKSYSGFQVGTEAVLPKKEEHPSLWFNRDELAAFKKTLNADETMREYWDKVKNHELLTVPFPEVIPEDELPVPELANANNKRIHQYYGA